jgi:hypothetical protein
MVSPLARLDDRDSPPIHRWIARLGQSMATARRPLVDLQAPDRVRTALINWLRLHQQRGHPAGRFLIIGAASPAGMGSALCPNKFRSLPNWGRITT